MKLKKHIINSRFHTHADNYASVITGTLAVDSAVACCYIWYRNLISNIVTEMLTDIDTDQ